MKAWVSAHPVISLLVFALAGGLTIVVLQLLGLIDVPAWWQSLWPWWRDAGWPWTSSWLTSPGFGGFAAVVAASLAFAGTRHQSRLNAWWQRVEWALNLYVNPDTSASGRAAGAAAIDALQSSRLARREEKAFLGEVAAAVTFDALGDGLDEDDWTKAERDALGDADAEGEADLIADGLHPDDPLPERL